MAGGLVRGKLIAVIGDEDTCTGFLLGGGLFWGGGVGNRGAQQKPQAEFPGGGEGDERDGNRGDFQHGENKRGLLMTMTRLCQIGGLALKTLVSQSGPAAMSFLQREDIGIILINQFIAEMIRHAIDAHNVSIPAVLEIPSKEHPYDANKDSILRRAKGMFTSDDLR
ncbi:unnamed protein product [Ranitomeya imitator]|uniref:V-ATPase 14 kDa subunit n=1 Tax=Ranitomeya imitator TaxID=111125 RepID=A0ABN9KYA6_9NEOB|nr:unnamed protein product [Ranitomeya imitator]